VPLTFVNVFLIGLSLGYECPCPHWTVIWLRISLWSYQMKIVAPNAWIKRSNSNLATWLGTQLSTDELEVSKLEAKGGTARK
jgi:hypothetical protein